jgi:heme-degrading monooxygenase HmoA
LTTLDDGRTLLAFHAGKHARRAGCATFLSLAYPRKERFPMYTRVVEFNTKPGKARELCDTINDKAVPILKKQDGFMDETVLASDTESSRVLGLSFWNSKEDAARYHREQYPKIHEMLKHLLESEPVIQTFDVQSSTTYRIAGGKAA